jgi:hypothetical protein
MQEKRSSERKRLELITVVRKPLSHQGATLMEFISRDLSEGGIFILSEDLSVFDLGEELDILIDNRGERYYEGRARVVRSARIISDREARLESGFGLMFEAPKEDFRRMLDEQLRRDAD